jgi:hypothetical protein
MLDLRQLENQTRIVAPDNLLYDKITKEKWYKYGVFYDCYQDFMLNFKLWTEN